jgi:hypothetical protein
MHACSCAHTGPLGAAFWTYMTPMLAIICALAPAGARSHGVHGLVHVHVPGPRHTPLLQPLVLLLQGQAGVQWGGGVKGEAGIGPQAPTKHEVVVAEARGLKEGVWVGIDDQVCVKEQDVVPAGRQAGRQARGVHTAK